MSCTQFVLSSLGCQVNSECTLVMCKGVKVFTPGNFDYHLEHGRGKETVFICCVNWRDRRLVLRQDEEQFHLESEYSRVHCTTVATALQLPPLDALHESERPLEHFSPSVPFNIDPSTHIHWLVCVKRGSVGLHLSCLAKFCHRRQSHSVTCTCISLLHQLCTLFRPTPKYFFLVQSDQINSLSLPRSYFPSGHCLPGLFLTSNCPFASDGQENVSLYNCRHCTVLSPRQLSVGHFTLYSR